MYIHVLREDKPNGKTRSSSAVANHQAIPLRQKRRQFFYIPDTAASVSCCFLPTNSEMKSGSCNWTNFTEATILENKNSWSISFSFFLRESVELRVYHTHRYKTRSHQTFNTWSWYWLLTSQYLEKHSFHKLSINCLCPEDVYPKLTDNPINCLHIIT